MKYLRLLVLISLIFNAFGSLGVHPAAAATDLMGQWKFDETTGTTAADSSGNNNTGTLQNGPTWVTAGKINGAINFDGTNDRVSVPHSTSLSLNTNLVTIAAWVRLDTNSRSWITVIERDRANLQWMDWQIYARAADAPTANRPVCRFDWDGDTVVDADEQAMGNITLATNTWYHLACTYDGTALRFYIDGTLRGTTNSANRAIRDSGHPVFIGANEAWGEYLDGQVDDARIYNRALSQTEIQAIMVGTPQYTLTATTVGSGTITKNPDKTSYNQGEIVQVTAAPAAGWSFSGWSGALSGTTNPATVTMDANKTVTATFTQNQYSLSVDVAGSGTVTKNPNKTSYIYGETVQLTAVPAAGWSFTGWSGGLSGSANPATITMNANKTVTATFTQNQYSLAVSIAGSGSVVKNPDKTSYTYGEAVQLTALPTAGWNFTGWSGGLSGSTNPATITMDANKSVTASFAQNQYSLTVNLVGSGTVSKNPDKATYNPNESVQLTATPAIGWSFTGWSGAVSGTTNPETITMDSNKTVTATFTQNQYTLTTNVNPEGSGSITKSPDKATYTHGELVQLTAVPADGYRFSGWSGGVSGSTNPLTLTMDASKIITATFTAIPTYTLVINTAGDGSVTKNPDQASYREGSVVQLTANPGPGKSFGGWSGDLGGTTNPVTITMDSNKTVTASFTTDQFTLTINVVGSGNVTRDPDKTTYTYGESVLLSVESAPGWSFGGWSDDLNGTANPATIVMDANKSVTATFTQNQYTLSISLVGSGSVTRLPAKATYTHGDSVQLSAAGDPGWIFSGWSGDLVDTTNPISITMDGNKAITATFSELPHYSLTVNVVGSGSIEKNPDKSTYFQGETVELSAIPVSGWAFTGWSGDMTGTTNPVTIPMDGNKNFTATFTEIPPEQYILGVNVVGSGTVTKVPDQIIYEDGTPVQLNAIPAAGWTFTGWSGDLSGMDNPAAIVMDGNKTITATFAAIPYTLTVNITGSGTVAKNPEKATYIYGESVELTASPALGWTFTGWSGDASGADTPVSLTIDGNKTVNATFAQNVYSLTVNLVGSGIITRIPDKTTYTYGEIVQLTAVSEPGWTFSGWSGNISGTTNPATITMDGNKTISATFLQDTYTLTVNTVGSGTVTKIPDQATYLFGETVQLSATAAAGWSFTGWSGDQGGTTSPVTVTMNGNKTITASFTRNQHTLTVNVVGNGLVTKVPDQAAYDEGSSVQLSAVPATGWTFSGWSGDLSGKTNPATIVMDANRTVTATFSAIAYSLTVNKVGNGAITINPDKPSYGYGESVELTATPAAGWSFNGWSGDLNGATSPASITIDGDKTVTATFTQDQYSLSINLVGNGSVTKNPDQISYVYADVVQLTANPAAGWAFTGWSGALTGQTNPATLTMNANKAVTANFTRIQHTLTINVVGNGAVTKTPDQASYDEGAAVQINATPTAGWIFSGWSGALSGTTNPATVTMDNDKTITATFTQDAYSLTVNLTGSGTVAKNPDKSSYVYNETVQLTATAATGWTFTGWSGSLSGTANPATISMNGNKTVTATFTRNQYTLTITVVGSGSVTKAPNQTTYGYGDLVALTAVPAGGWNFGGWSGALSGSTNPANLTMDANKAVTATFTQTPSANLVAHWKFDETSGTVAADSSGNNNPGTLTNGPTWTTAGKLNGALNFDGSNDRVSAPDSASLRITSNRITLAAWVRADTVTQSWTTIIQRSRTGLAWMDWQIYARAADSPTPNRPVCRFDWDGDLVVDTDEQVQGDIILAANTWYHLACTYDGTALRFYIDGTLRNSTTSASKTIVNSTRPVWIGGNEAWGEYYDGQIDDTRIYNRALSQTEIQGIMAGAPQYTLTVNTTGSGTVTKNPDKTTYNQGEIVQLTAVPAAGWSFGGWSGALSGTANPASITMDANKTATATFTQNQYTLSLNVVGNGSVAKSPDKLTYTYGEVVQLTATPTAGYRFSGWSGGLTGAANPANLTIDGNKTVTATFTAIPTYTLTVSGTGGGSVTKNPDQVSYLEGSVVQLTANPDPGKTFENWSGDLSGTSNPTTITMTANKTVTAIFSANQYPLTITVVGSGSVTKVPNRTNYAEGESVQLTAIPAAGWTFAGWSGGLSGADNPANIIMNGAQNVTATFTAIPYSLTITVVGSGSVTKNPDKLTYQTGDIVSLTAAPASGWKFSGWSGGLSGTTNPANITVNGDKTVTATFIEVSQYRLTINVSGSGVISRNPEKDMYDEGEIVQLTATPSSGWSFTGWSGGLSGTTNPASITMNADKTVNATFVQLPPTELVGHWKFDASSGTTAADSSTYGNTGTLQNGPTWITGGKFNGALNFDGTDDRVSVPDSASLRLTSNRITLAAWVHPDTVTNSWMTVMQRSRTGLGWMDWQIYARAGDASTPNRPVCRFDWDGDTVVDPDEEVMGNIILAANTWYHLACTYDGTAVRFYIDGTLRGTTASPNHTIVNSARPVWIGGNEAWGEYFDGQIDDVRIYNRALSEAEIKVVAGGNPPPTPHAGICEDFETGFTLGQTVGTNTEWYDGGGGPVVNTGNGLGGSVGLAPASNIFTWTAHPFNWNATDFLGVEFQMDYQTDGSGQFDDDRLGWMTDDASTDSLNLFGVQLDHTDGGIVTFWRDASDARVQTPIVTLPNLTANTWYRLHAKFTKLTAASAKIEVNLVQLDANGIPTGTPYTGVLADTSLWPDGTPPARYFNATSMWPAYKNINGITGGVDNACFNLVSNRFAFVVTSDWHTSSNQSNVEANLVQIRNWLDTPTSDMPSPEFMVITGDFPNLDQTQSSIDRQLGSDFLWYPVIGNHEVSDNINNFTSIRDTLVPSLPFLTSTGPAGSVNTTYSWNFGTAHFVAINGYWDGTTGTNADHAADGNVTDPMRSWIDADLDASSQIHKFAFIHEPAYPEARHIGDALDLYPANRDAFVTMLDSDQVVALFAGHDHYYHHDTAAEHPLLGDLQQINNASFQNFSADDGASITYVLVEGDLVTFKVYRSTTGSPFTLAEQWVAGRSLPTEPPAAPDDLTATAYSASQVNLGWSDNADNEARFEIERSTTGTTGAYSLLVSLPANTATYSDLNLTPLAEYCYRVRAVNVIGSSEYTEPACATTPNGPSTLTFQDGLNGYASTVDTLIMQSEPAASHATLDMIDWDTDDPSGSGQYNYALLRFDNIFGASAGQIPVGSTIQSAILHYNVSNTGAVSNVNEIAINWAETDTYNNFGGEAGVQSDEYGTARGTASGAATGDQTIDLTASLAAWASNASANHGWIFRPTGTDGVDIRSSEYATSGERPRLVVQFTPPGGPTTYTLSVTVAGNGAVTKNPDRAYYNTGEVVQLTAVPATGWVFSGWSGNLSGSTNPASVAMDANKTITATFTLPVELAGTCESFNTGFTLGQTIGTNTGWYDGGNGPVVNSGIGLSSSVGLAPSSATFTWTAHPFTWDASDLAAISFSMDYQTNSSGQFDDDRLGWTINNTNVDSVNQFGVQLDHSDGGIVTFWRDASDARVQTPIVALPNLTANTWFRLQAKFTKLTATSAKIEVNLAQLDANGLPTGTPYTGTLADTSLWPDGTPPARYFNATSMWPSFKNFSAVTGAADNVCYEVTPGRFAFVVTSDWHTSSNQSNVEANLVQIRNWLDTPTSDMPSPEFMVITGDFPNLAQTQSSIDRQLGSDFLWYPVIGNHEVSDNINNFTSIRDTLVPSLPFLTSTGPTGSVNTTYSWNFGTAHFVAINGYWDGTTGPNADHATDGNITDPLRSWIDADLDASSQIHKFAFIHEPAYPEARHMGDALDQYPANRDAFVTMLDSDQVVALFAGHDHYYHHDTAAEHPLLGDLAQINNASFQNFSADDGASITYVLVEGDLVTFKVYRSTTGSPFTLAEQWTEGSELPACYALTLSHSGQGVNPTASPTNSTGCPSGQYLAGASVSLSGAAPAAGWQIDSWSGTSNDSSTASTNTVIMPTAAHTASVIYTEIPPSTLTCESFNAFTPGATIGTYAGWSDGSSGAGPVVTAGNGVAGSNGLAGASSIFNWTAHPFNWSAADFQKIILQQDFQSSSTSTFDDDRLSWTLNGTSNVSDNEVGVQLDNTDGGIVTYWRTATGTQVKNVIATLTGIQANTWYRFTSESTKLTSTSARIDVSLVRLDTSGNPTGTPITGSIPNTALVSGVPNPSYFTTPNLVPSYKNYNASSGAADNTCYQVVTSTPASYTLTTNVVGSGTITRNPDQTSYASGTVVTLTAHPTAGWHFVEWTGDLTSTTNPATIALNGNKSVTAVFVKDPVTLTVSVAGGGTVAQLPEDPYLYGDSVQLTAHPATGWHFVEWTGDLTSTTNPATITLNGNKSVTAAFAKDPVTLVVTVTGSGNVNQVPPAPYLYGDSVVLTASPTVGWIFDHWTGDLTGSTNPDSVTLSQNKNITAVFTQNCYTLTTTVSPVVGGSIAADVAPNCNGGTQYLSGTVVKLTANAGVGFGFDRWTGDLIGSTNPQSITIDADKTVNAGFALNAVTLLVNVVGSGSVNQSPSGPYFFDDDVELAAVPATGWHFVEWTGDLTSTTNPDTITLNGNKSVTAVFAKDLVTLTVSVAGGGTVAQLPEDPYLYGDSVQLTAHPATGWHFVEWTGDLTSTTNPDTITLNGNKSVTAAFAKDPVTLVVTVTGSGTVNQVPPAPYLYGDSVQLTAHPATGWHFVEWTGDLTGADNPAGIILNSSKNVTAKFEANTFTLTYAPGLNGTLTGVTSQTVNYGQDGTAVTAVPNAGYHFVDWSDGSNANPRTDTGVTANISVTANFAISNRAPDQPTLVSPANGATDVPYNATLSVTPTDPDSDAMTVTFYGKAASATTFTLAVLPDTQNYSLTYPDIFTAQTQWIVDNRAAKNIVFVSHEGDVTNNNSAAEWTNASTAMYKLENATPEIPYGILLGNHDLPASANFTSLFGVTHFQSKSYYGGHYSSDNQNNYELFSAAGMDFIAVHLSYGPSTEVITWADGVLKAYPTRRAIVTSHDVIDTSANFSTYGSNIYNALKNNANLFLILGGHYHGEARRTDTDSGHTIYSLLADYQNDANGGNGWMRTLEFSPATDEILVKTYSPTLGQSQTDTASQFTLAYDMTPPQTYQVIGTNSNVASGATTSVIWSNLPALTQQEWYVNVSDAALNTTSSNWTFTTQGPPCYVLTLTHAGSGSDPVASPSNSIGCSSGQYLAGANITLTASPASGNQVASWTGTNNDSSTSTTNTLTMPAEARSANVTYVASPVGNYAVQTNGSNSYIRVNNDAALGVQTFTIETWFKRLGTGATASSGSGGITTVEPLVSKGRSENDGSNIDTNYLFGIQGGKLGADFEECASTQAGCPGGTAGLNHPVVGATTIQNNIWYHGAVTYDGRYWRLYLNGVQDGYVDLGTSILPRWDSIQPIGIGTAFDSTGTAAGDFNGVIDEVRIWNTVRTLAQIQADMYSENPSGTGLVGHWSLNENTGTVANDTAGTAQNGTLTNTPTWVAGFPQPTCFALTLSHTGNGSDPLASPTNSVGCPTGQYVEGANITLTASPASGYQVASWTGTNNNSSTSTTNTLTMPAAARSANVTYVASPVNIYALQFNGSSQYVTFGTSQGQTGSGLGVQVFTIETWFKKSGAGVTTTTGTGGVTAVPLVTKGRGEAENSNVDMNYFFGIDSTGVLAADFEECARTQSGCPQTTSNATQGGQNYPAKSSTVIQNNVWYHAAVTFDGRYWKFYLNGVQDGATTDTGASRYPRWDSIQHAGIGTAMTSAGAAAGFFNGIIDETRIWNVVRTQAEIQASMNAELTGGTGLIARWGLNEGSGTTAANSIAGRPTGTLTNNPTWVAGFPQPTCLALTLSHTGSGSDPVASPTNSSGCGAGQYLAGEAINLTAAPDSGYQVSGWSGTNNDGSTATTNTLTMPAAARTVSVTYTSSTGWSAFNDCVYDPTQALEATDPNGQLVHYIGTNVTTFGIGTNYTGPTSGILVNHATGASTGVTAALTQSGGVVWQPEINSPWNGGYDTAVGTDARTTFGGIADMTGVIYYAPASGWYVDLTLSGLNPAKTYTFATSASRANSTYTTRSSRYTLSGVDGATNASTTGVTVINNLSVAFNTGDNHANGYVARWSGIRPGADGTITIRAEADTSEYRGYGFSVYTLKEE